MAMQMRFLQTLADVGTEKNTTIVFPVPMDLISAFVSRSANDGAQVSRATTEVVPMPRASSPRPPA